MKKSIIIISSALMMFSCGSVKDIGDLNMIASRNIDSKMSYTLIRSYMGGGYEEINQTRMKKITSIEDAVNLVVKKTPGGEFMKNVKVKLIDNKYIAVEGDVWGVKTTEEQSFKGFVKGSHVLYQKGRKIKKGYIVALKDDKICFFQEFGTIDTKEVEYSEITKSEFSDQEIKDYINATLKTSDKKEKGWNNIFMSTPPKN
ncbi:hypothetical protein GOQ04_23830 [Emticicia sp. ODNR4P]|nr:hypothetical protein [Emticicia sp. ODNR4P]